MRFRKLLIATAAVVAAGAMALAPAAQAVAPSNVDVNGDSTNTAHSLSGAMVPNAGGPEVTMQTLFGNVSLNCSSGTAAGVVNGGSFGTKPNPVFEFDTLSLNCDSFIQGTTVTMDLICDVTTNITDVTGGVASGTTAFNNATQPCVKVTVSSGCTAYFTGNVATTFTNGTQDLVLNGGGSTVASGAYAPSGCLGIISAGYTLTLHNVTFDFSSAATAPITIT